MSKILEILAAKAVQKAKGSGIDFFDLTPWNDEEMSKFYADHGNSLSWRLAKNRGMRNPSDSARCKNAGCYKHWLHCHCTDKYKW